MSCTEIQCHQQKVRRETYHKGCSEEDDGHRIPRRRRRKPNRGEALALDQPVERTSRSEEELRKEKKLGGGEKIAWKGTGDGG